MENIYATNKILYHSDKIAEMRSGIQCNPVQLHLMPDNRCNHNCTFCSYRIENNKNNEVFDRSLYIPKDIVTNLIHDFSILGGKAIEITGGGEPLNYPYFKDMVRLIKSYGLDYSLVSNGTKLDSETAELMDDIVWARISIDAGTEKTYEAIRRCRSGDFGRALNALSLLRKNCKNPQFRLGAGFVVTNENYREVGEFVRLAKESGADNVRISAVFHPDGINYFHKETVEIGSRLSAEADAEYSDDGFTVYNLFDERVGNAAAVNQDYKFCGTKELLCVVGGDCNVYYCCSLAFSKRGIIGSLKDSCFYDLWKSEKKRDKFSCFDASKQCPNMCLYEKRNKYINELLRKDVAHVNFI